MSTVDVESTVVSATPPAEVPKPFRVIYMFRMVNGEKVRWKFEVDNQMVIMSEGAAPTNPIIEAAKPPINKVNQVDPIDIYKRTLTERGINYTVSPTGQIIIAGIPEKEKQIMQFFDLNKECPDIPGMETIRNNYKEEYNQLGGASCPSCQMNSLQRKYRAILDQKLFVNA
jgi:hypothetical protein